MTLSPGKAFLFLMALIVAVGGFIGLSMILKIDATWVGFLFLTYWAAVDQAKFAALPTCIVGSFFGLLVAYAFQTAPSLIGSAGLPILVVFVLGTVYCAMVGWFKIAINIPYYFFLTVGNIPAIQQHDSFPRLLVALAWGIVYFVSLVALVQYVASLRARAETTPTGG